MESTLAVQPSLRSYGFITIAILGWGLSTSFIEQGLDSIEPMTFLGIRFLSATLILTPIVLLRHRSDFVDLMRNKWVWFVGISEALGLTFQYFGQQRSIPAGLASLLSLLFILIVPFISPFMLKVKLNPLHLVAVAIALGGVILISSEGQRTNLLGGSISGVILLLMAAFFYAIYITTTSRLTTVEKKDINTFALFYAILLIIAIMTSALSLVTEGSPQIPSESWKWIMGLVIVSTLIAFFAYFEALKEIPANMASVLLLLQALIPFLIDYFILERSYSFWILVGSFLILIAIVVVVVIPYLDNSPEEKMDFMQDSRLEITGGK